MHKKKQKKHNKHNTKRKMHKKNKENKTIHITQQYKPKTHYNAKH